MKKEAEKINSTQERCHSNVPERFREPLIKVAYKLLSRDKATFEELTPSEQNCGIHLKPTRFTDFLLENLIQYQNLDSIGTLWTPLTDIVSNLNDNKL